MNRFVPFAVAAATVLAAAAPAFAGDIATQARPARALQQRVVMMCDTDVATRRSFTREHGAPPVFVTAEQVLAARASGETWAAPRCMTAREHGRLTQLTTSYAGVR